MFDNNTEETGYINIRKILMPISYIVIIIALVIIVFQVVGDNKLLDSGDSKEENISGSIIPVDSGSVDSDLELNVDIDLMIKGLSYFNLAKNGDKEKKNEYYLKTIRTLTSLIASNLSGDENSEINSIVYYHLAYSYLLFGEEYFAISLKYLLKAEELNKKDNLLAKVKNGGKMSLLELYEITGSIYYQLNQYENTIEYFNKAKELNESDKIYDIILAQSYYEIGKYKESFEYYKKVLEDRKQIDVIKDGELTKSILLQVSKLHYEMGDYLEAVDSYKRYINLYGETAELRYMLGKIYETLSFKAKTKAKSQTYLKKAISEWKKSLELKPDYGRAMLKLWRYNEKI